MSLRIPREKDFEFKRDFATVGSPSVRSRAFCVSMRGVYHHMHRIGFCRALPLALTLIHLVLVWSSLEHQTRADPILFQELEYRAVTYQEGSAGVQMETFGEPPPLKPAQKTALIIELPALFVATLIGAVLIPRNEAAWLYTSVPLVPLVWYAVGRWLDGLLGYITRLYLPRILRGLLSVLAIGVLLVSIAGLTPLYHHRTADTYWIFSGLVLWSGLCIAIMASSGRRAS